ncbi:long-chain fatty acid-CoA ligase [Borealophlyctis nickersoniae]|nr:long-chain fatty acid-CoA ligase [Borealophlyctis nickersoniae]
MAPQTCRSVITSHPGDPDGFIIRNAEATNGLVNRPQAHIGTMYDLMTHVATKFPKNKSFGMRSIVREVEEEKEITKIIGGVPTKEKKSWKFFELSPYSFLTYSEVRKITHDIGAGLRKIGMNPGDKLTIFAATSRQWMLTAHACFTQNMTITTAYDTLGEEGLTFSLNECEIGTIFTTADLLPMIQKITPNVPTLHRVIYSGVANAAVLEKLKSSYSQLTFYTLDEIQELGAANPYEPVPPKPDDIACIMYTSGSTGNPKGVMLAHSNVICSVAGAMYLLSPIARQEDVYLAYLPLAHVLEFVAQSTVMYYGMTIGYGSPRTLSDTSVRNCRGDIPELRPTLMTGVPAVWEAIRKGVNSKLKDAPPVQRRIFEFALASKWRLMKIGAPTNLIDAVFAKIKASTGGRLRMALSGGAPVSAETQQFLTTTVCTVIQGYGMTESTGVMAIQHPNDPTILGRCGPPAIIGEFKLVPVKDTNYSPLNKPNPQGEVWWRSANVMKGYYRQEALTRENVTRDGWLMTGDIGEYHPDGSIQIIDRKKNLIKLSNGEYIALEKLEACYKTSKFVQNVCVYGDSLESFAVALVVPIEKELADLAKEKGLFQGRSHFDLEELCMSPEIKKEVLADLRACAKKADFKPAEIVGSVWLIHEEWTPQNGMLTAAQKLKRKEINDANKEIIQKMYKAGKM